MTTDRSVLSTLALLFLVAGAGQLISAAPAIGAIGALGNEKPKTPRANADPMVLTPGTPIAPSSAGPRALSTDDGIAIADERPQFQLAKVEPTGPVPPSQKPQAQSALRAPDAPPPRMTRAGQQRFAAIYARMPASKAAEVLAALTPAEAASFIAAMPEEAGADILAAMPAEAAVAITREVLRVLP